MILRRKSVIPYVLTYNKKKSSGDQCDLAESFKNYFYP